MGGRGFIVGSEYTREEIHKEIGGSVRSYLPTVGRRVVCACLQLDLNPKAPDVILVGTGSGIRRAGQWLCEQGAPIPVFLKRDVKRWEYRGMWRVQRWMDLPDDILREGERMAQGSVSRVILMKQSGD